MKTVNVRYVVDQRPILKTEAAFKRIEKTIDRILKKQKRIRK